MIKRSTGIQDAGVPLKVDHFTRKVTVPVTERVIGVVGDHCSEQVTFSLARNIDNHDMTTCTSSYVAWRNVDGGEGTDDLVITEVTEDHILFGWTVRDAITVAKGLVSFSLHFECWDAEKLVYKWGTHTCSECEILDAINTKMGAYAAIYIDGETLVFSDYTPVREETLELSSGIIPEGTLEITEAGKHDVARYAYADVKAIFETPNIEIVDGKAKAEANGLTAEKGLETPNIEIVDGKAKAEANGLTAEKGLETPDITITNGKVTAEANGLTAEKGLETPKINIVDGEIKATANGLEATRKIWVDEYCKRTRVSIEHTGTGYVMYEDFHLDTNALTLRTLTFTADADNPYELTLIAGSSLYFVSAKNEAPRVNVEGYPFAVKGTLSGFVGQTVVTVPTVDKGVTVSIYVSNVAI